MRVEDIREQENVVEAVLFTMGQSVEVRQLAAALEVSEKEAAEAAERLRGLPLPERGGSICLEEG